MTYKIACFSSQTGKTWKTKQQLLKEMLEADVVTWTEERKIVNRLMGYDDIKLIQGSIPIYYITYDNGTAYFSTIKQIEEIWCKYLKLKENSSTT